MAAIPAVSILSASRLQIHTTRAAVCASADATSGSALAASTLVNRDPGASRTKSAWSIASNTPAATFGRSGTKRSRRILVSAAPIADSPWMSSPPASPTSDTDSAVAGSTRPEMPSRSPSHSVARARSPKASAIDRIIRFPSGWQPRRLTVTGRLNARPSATSSPVNATSERRRSPTAGPAPRRLSSPEEPPSSATVTITVSWALSWRTAYNTEARPWPPPITAIRLVTAALLDGDGLSEVTRLIDIESARPCQVVGEQLQWHDPEYDLEQRVGARNVKDVLGIVADFRASGARDGEHPGAPSARLRQIGQQLWQHALLRRHADHRSITAEHRDRPVLHLAGGIGIGGNVGDLLQLQRALHRHWQSRETSQIQEERAPGESLCLLSRTLVDRVHHLGDPLG